MDSWDDPYYEARPHLRLRVMRRAFGLLWSLEYPAKGRATPWDDHLPRVLNTGCDIDITNGFTPLGGWKPCKR